MAKLNVGIVGAGRVADLHALGYREHPQADIVAVCDLNEDRAISRSLDWEASSYYTDYGRMLEEEDLDAVEILTPNHLHHTQAIRALESGHHVCVERPIALTIPQADQVVRAARDADKVLQVYEPCLFHKPMLDARNLIDAGEIGDPTAVRLSANVSSSDSGVWNFRAAGPGQWRFDAEKSGGAPLLFDVSYQAFCIALFLIGSVEKIEVWRNFTDIGEDLQLDAPTTAIWKHFQQDCLGTFSLTHTPERRLNTQHHPLEFEVEVIGSRGDVSIVRSPDPSRYNAAVELQRQGRTIMYSQKPRAFEQSFERATHNFIDACLGGGMPLLRGTEAKQLLVLTLAFNESAKHGQSVSLQHG